MTKNRSQIIDTDKWNIEALYPDLSSWEKELKAFCSLDSHPRWSKLASYRDKLGDNPNVLHSALTILFSIARKLTKLYAFAHLKHDEDITHDFYKQAHHQIVSLLHDFEKESSWIEPELLSLPKSTVESYLNDPILKEYKFHLEKVFRLKEHTLSPEKEELLAQAGRAMQCPQKAFSMINDADFQFGSILDSNGSSFELTHGSYGVFLRSKDRQLRKNAFLSLHKKYAKYQNTIAELLQGQTQSHHFLATAKKYSSCLEAALFPKNIPESVYHSLLSAINDNLNTLHAYIDLRKKHLGLSSLHLYDLQVPLFDQLDVQIPYDEAEDLVIESVAPLGEEYQSLLKKGLKTERWVDRYENKNKRSGAYSSGCYDSFPYILMNYNGTIRDLFTLAHEAGHSMHSLLSHTNQPYHYGDYPIFLAEVASTFNEDLLYRHLLSTWTNPEQKIYLINQKIEDIRATLFRQAMFAEFELFIHTLTEKNQPLIPTTLNKKYRELNQKYYGPSLSIDSEAETEWARIPHFYYNFYVFQYATGISAALSLSKKVSAGEKKERDDYLKFLKGGSSLYPIDILKQAGINMEDKAPIETTLHIFSDLVKELDSNIQSAQ